MSEQPAPSRPNPVLQRIGRMLENVLFASRWLMLPFYVGLVVSLAVLFLKFLRMLWDFVLHAPG
ncbi:MAG: TIGR00645 family protein, partial [Alphaproteobacteria bacterium]